MAAKVAIRAAKAAIRAARAARARAIRAAVQTVGTHLEFTGLGSDWPKSYMLKAVKPTAHMNPGLYRAGSILRESGHSIGIVCCHISEDDEKLSIKVMHLRSLYEFLIQCELMFLCLSFGSTLVQAHVCLMVQQWFRID